MPDENRISLLDRVRRKIASIARYPRLSCTLADVPALMALGLIRNRMPLPGLVSMLLNGGGRILAPRVSAAFGQRIRVNLDEQGNIDTFDELFLDKVYELGAVDFEPSLVLDCGGYCGYFSAMSAGRFPRSRIVCFEANPSNLGMLKGQLDLLGEKVELVPEAVHTRDGTTWFSGSGTGGAVSDSLATASSVEVRCLDLPVWLRRAAPASLVLKMDVEGAEAELLPALLPLLPQKTVIYLETHYPDSVCDSMLAPYGAAGFAIHRVRSRPAPGGSFSYIEWLIKRKH